MNRHKIFWVILISLGVLILGNAFLSEYFPGSVYVKAVEVNADDPDHANQWTKYRNANPRDYIKAEAEDPNQVVYQFSLSRTIGVWVAALFTLFIFSFLYRDNPFYKIAEAVVVGVSAAYWMVVAFWTTIVPNLLGKLIPNTIKEWAMPGLEAEVEFLYIFPLILGIMLLMRLSPKGGWISRWPLAFIIGTTAGIRLTGFIHADFLSQIRNTIMPIWVADSSGMFDFWGSLRSLIIVLGVLAGIVYFFFSIEHKGWVGKIARGGIWVLMITFGAAFGYTVMGRIALLAIRLEFLMDDWLWIIDPGLKRLGM